MQSHDLLTWVVIGLVAGALASRVVEGRGMGCLGNLVVGAAGAVLGGIALDRLDPGTDYGFLGSIVVAFIGAAVLLALLRLLSGGRHLGRPWWDRRRGVWYRRRW